MELKIFNKDAKETGKIKLPIQFSEPVREDLIKKAVLALRANNRQKYGASPEAGKRASAYVSKRRRAYKTTYGIGQSRTPRKVISRSGTRFNWVGAFAPQTVGGRRAHPPKASKSWNIKINLVERRKAIKSALSAVIAPELVKLRGHIIPDTYPFVLNDEFNDILKTSVLKNALLKLGLGKDLERASIKKVRAGKGKARGRKHRTKKSVLFVVSNEVDLFRAVSNLPGCEVALVNNLNADLLAPGAMPGRLTLFTESAIKKLKDESLFLKSVKKENKEPVKKKQTSTKKDASPKEKIIKTKNKKELKDE